MRTSADQPHVPARQRPVKSQVNQEQQLSAREVSGRSLTCCYALRPSPSWPMTINVGMAGRWPRKWTTSRPLLTRLSQREREIAAARRRTSATGRRNSRRGARSRGRNERSDCTEGIREKLAVLRGFDESRHGARPVTPLTSVAFPLPEMSEAPREEPSSNSFQGYELETFNFPVPMCCACNTLRPPGAGRPSDGVSLGGREWDSNLAH
jgi:hypothetical protein